MSHHSGQGLESLSKALFLVSLNAILQRGSLLLNALFRRGSEVAGSQKEPAADMSVYAWYSHLCASVNHPAQATRNISAAVGSERVHGSAICCIRLFSRRLFHWWKSLESVMFYCKKRPSTIWKRCVAIIAQVSCLHCQLQLWECTPSCFAYIHFQLILNVPGNLFGGRWMKVLGVVLCDSS